MTDHQLQLVETPGDDVRRAILSTLGSHNEQIAGPSGHQTLAVSLIDATGKPCGGLWGATAYGWLYTQLLAVPEAHRQQGWGKKLMLAAEAEARRRGCHHAWVDTIFGARGFYEGLGYTVFGSLPNYPTGFTRHFLSKALNL
jgi:GNAT superfamily N-acetyltransferase